MPVTVDPIVEAIRHWLMDVMGEWVDLLSEVWHTTEAGVAGLWRSRVDR